MFMLILSLYHSKINRFRYFLYHRLFKGSPLPFARTVRRVYFSPTHMLHNTTNATINSSTSTKRVIPFRPLPVITIQNQEQIFARSVANKIFLA